MMGFLRFILQVILLAALALWLADEPGTAHIVWHDTVIDTSAAFLGVALLIFGYVLYLFFRLWHFLRHGPMLWRLHKKLGKQKRGTDQITAGLMAIASGDAAEAGRLAVAARKSLGDITLTQWLQAQAAQLAGDMGAARNIFKRLANHQDTAVLGYRGLITDAKRAGKWDEVDRLIRELYQLKPETPWLSLVRIESAARRQNWDEAELALTKAIEAHLLDSASGKRTRAALCIATSRQERSRGNKEAALQAAEKAARQTPDWLPALINLAENLAATGHTRVAIRTIERAWQAHPHPQLARLLRRMASAPLDAFKQTERLCRDTQGIYESQMALAEAAFEANVWGEARRYLMASIDDQSATQSTYKLLSNLERRERNDERAAALWLARASDAPADSSWLCHVCGGTTQEEWQPVCIYCGAFDSQEWQRAGKKPDSLSYTKGFDEND